MFGDLPTGIRHVYRQQKVCRGHGMRFGSDECVDFKWAPVTDEQGQKIPTGRYLVRVPIMDAATGRRRYVGGTHDSLGAATREAERIRTDRERGQSGRLPSKTKFSDVAGEWLQHRRNRGRASESTLRSYQKNIDKANAVFGNKVVQKLTPGDIETLIKQQAADGLTITTIRGVLRDVRSVLDRAVLLEVVHRNVARLVEPTGAPPRRRPTLADDDHQRLLQNLIGHRNEAAWALSVDAGLRRGEVLGLRWRDIGEDGSIRIERTRTPAPRKSAHQGDPRTVVGTPKSRKSYRIITVWPSLRARIHRNKALRKAEYVALGVPWDEDAYICVNEDTRRSPLAPMLPDRYSRLWAELCAAAGVAKLPLHSARHGSVTRMRDRGIPTHLVAAFHGHDEAMTTRIYTHADDLSPIATAMDDTNVDSRFKPIHGPVPPTLQTHSAPSTPPHTSPRTSPEPASAPCPQCGQPTTIYQPGAQPQCPHCLHNPAQHRGRT